MYIFFLRQVINFLDAASVPFFYRSFHEKWFRDKKSDKIKMMYHDTQGKRGLINKYISEIIKTPTLQGSSQMWDFYSRTEETPCPRLCRPVLLSSI